MAWGADTRTHTRIPTRGPKQFQETRRARPSAARAWFKNQNTKNLPQRYNYSSNNTISSFKQAKCCNTCPLENFKKTRMRLHFHLTACLPASLPACQQELT